MTVQLASPMEDAVTRAGELLTWHRLEVGRPRGHGWLAAQSVPDGDRLDRWLEQVAAHHAIPARTSAAYLLAWYTAGITAAAAPLLTTQGRLPGLAPGTVAVHRARGHWVDRTAVGGALRVLPDDPLAKGPDVTVVPDRAGLRRALAADLLVHLAPVSEGIGARRRLGSRVRWGLIADAVAGIFLQVGRACGDEAAARADADGVLDALPLPARARPGWLPITHAGAEHLFVARSACCLAFTAGHATCATCPAVAPEERERRLRAYLEEQARR